MSSLNERRSILLFYVSKLYFVSGVPWAFAGAEEPALPALVHAPQELLHVEELLVVDPEHPGPQGVQGGVLFDHVLQETLLVHLW